MSRFISLRELKDAKLPELQDMQLLRRPQLSVQRVSSVEWECIMALERTVVDTPASPTVAKGSEHTEESRDNVHAQDAAVKAEIMASHGGAL